MEDHRPEVGHQGLIAISLRVVERLKIIIIAGLIIEVVLSCCTTIGAFDFPWQLAEGEFILNHGYPVHSVLQAYGEISPHFANEYILYEILIAGINRVAGWLGLCFFFGLLGFLVYLPCLLALLRSRGRFTLIEICLFLLAQVIINMRLAARPELIAEVCYVAAGIMLMRRDGGSWSGLQTAGFGLIFCLWANAHGSFLIGLVMLGLWYGEKFLFNWRTMVFTRDFTWMRPGVAALIGCVLNPYGVFRFDQPFQLHGLLWGQATSSEMWPVTPALALLPITWTAAALIALFLRMRERRCYWMIALLLFLQYETFCSIRYVVFIALTLLIITWDGVRHAQKTTLPPFFQLSFALGRLISCFSLSIAILVFTFYLAEGKLEMMRNYRQVLRSQSLVATNSSFAWLKEHPGENYIVLAHSAVGSWAQMPGIQGIRPLIDSGSHRYSDRVNQLYYYTLFSPESLRSVVSELRVNTVVAGNPNLYWASVLNTNPDWRLAQIGPDSQLYLRGDNHDASADRKTFLEWEQNARRGLPDFTDISYDGIIRGFKLRPDEESLQMLQETRDAAWMFDPQIAYIEDWLKQVPDNLVEDALKSVGDKMDNSSAGLRILLSLRLRQYEQAAEIARKWNPSLLDGGYQDLQEFRVEAFISEGDHEAARKVLEALWPQPRYSLRWAKLCQQVYTDDPKVMPENARLLTGLADNFTWRDDLITSLNQNILRISAQSP